jgi:site-specific recombinase
MRSRRAELHVRTSPFHRLTRSTEALAECVTIDHDAREAQASWARDVEGCRSAVTETRAKLESTGVSVDVVYALDVIERGLVRMELIVAALFADPGGPRAAAAKHLMAELVRARLDDRSLLALAHRNLGLLARKVVERAGATGEHYIVRSRRGWFAMVASGLGGGVVTVFTAAAKIAISMRHLPLALEGLASGINYAASFVLIQVAGFTLATKQPAMTGAALAGVIEKSRGAERAEELAALFARIVRSQIAAALGNITAVISGVLLFDLAWRAATGAHYLDEAKADYVLHSLSPWGSGTVFYAALTGVVLWLASLVGGSVENWCTYRRLPQAIAEHHLGRRFGERFMRKLSEHFARRIADYSVNVALGLLLAFTPIVGKFFGLPLDVRHVTLSSGQLGLALANLGAGFWSDPRAHAGLAGIAVCFVLNLSVSFGLALRTALRARDVRAHDQREIVSAVLRKLARSPLAFVVPPKGEADAAHAPHDAHAG